MDGRVHSFESFGASDGPGIRFILFLQGCNMRCKYCHNPDTWKKDGDLKSAHEILSHALRYRDYWGSTGGITVSGGEPLLQPEFVTELFTLAKKEGIHTAIDTAGQPYHPDNPVFDKLLSVTDLVLLDIKHIDPVRHKSLTGLDNENILEFAKKLSEISKPVWIRHVYVPQLETDSELMRLSVFLKTLPNVEKVEILPYHTLGVSKWSRLGIDYPLKNATVPTKEQLAHARSFFEVDSL